MTGNAGENIICISKYCRNTFKTTFLQYFFFEKLNLYVAFIYCDWTAGGCHYPLVFSVVKNEVSVRVRVQSGDSLPTLTRNTTKEVRFAY